MAQAVIDQMVSTGVRLARGRMTIREHINIFIADEDVRFTGGLTSRLSTGSEISIVPAISGG
jgi:sulfur-carrier protein